FQRLGAVALPQRNFAEPFLPRRRFFFVWLPFITRVATASGASPAVRPRSLSPHSCEVSPGRVEAGSAHTDSAPTAPVRSRGALSRHSSQSCVRRLKRELSTGLEDLWPRATLSFRLRSPSA